MSFPSWLVHAAAFIVLWFALAIVLGVTFGAFVRHGGVSVYDPREYEPDPPDYRPAEDDPFAELFFEAAREQDEWETTDD